MVAVLTRSAGTFNIKQHLGSTDNKSTVVLQNILLTCSSSFNVPVTDLKALATNNEYKARLVNKH